MFGPQLQSHDVFLPRTTCITTTSTVGMNSMTGYFLPLGKGHENGWMLHSICHVHRIILRPACIEDISMPRDAESLFPSAEIRLLRPEVRLLCLCRHALEFDDCYGESYVSQRNDHHFHIILRISERCNSSGSGRRKLHFQSDDQTHQADTHALERYGLELPTVLLGRVRKRVLQPSARSWHCTFVSQPLVP